ncbi:MAG: four helix bundle protein [Kofleriaceae bacterium]
MRFIAYDMSLELIRGLRPSIARIRRHSRKMHVQIVDALASVSQNTGEGNGRFGGDRLHFFRIALGSLREVSSCLDVAVAFGWLDEAPLAAERDRLAGILFSLQRG